MNNNNNASFEKLEASGYYVLFISVVNKQCNKHERNLSQYLTIIHEEIRTI